MKIYRILLVTAEQAVADRLTSYLGNWGYQVVGTAASCRQAKSLYQRELPDMTLIDIQAGDCEQGVDLAHFIRNQTQSGLFMYLGSRPSRLDIRRVRETFPVGYVSKPIQPELLFANLEIAFYRYATQQSSVPGISLSDGGARHFLPLSSILYLEADHIYVKVYVADGRSITQRGSLSDLLRQLPAGQFVKTHRSYAVNVKQLNSWDRKYVYVQGQALPLSRGRRKAVLAVLEGGGEKT